MNDLERAEQARIILNRIEQLTKEKGMSINKMVEEAKLGKSFVDNLKRGSIPSAEKIRIVAEYFDVTSDYVLGKADIKKPTAKSGGQSNPLRAEIDMYIEKFIRENDEAKLKLLLERAEYLDQLHSHAER